MSATAAAVPVASSATRGSGAAATTNNNSWQLHRALDLMETNLWGGADASPKARRVRFMILVSMVLALLVITLLMAVSRRARWGKAMNGIGATVAGLLFVGLAGVMVFGGFRDAKVGSDVA